MKKVLILLTPVLLIAVVYLLITAFVCGIPLVKIVCNGLNFGGISDEEYIKIHHSGGKPIYNKDVMVLVYGEDGVVNKIEKVNEGKIKHQDENLKYDFTEEGFEFQYKRNIRMVPVLNEGSIAKENIKVENEKKILDCVKTTKKNRDDCEKEIDTYVMVVKEVPIVDKKEEQGSDSSTTGPDTKTGDGLYERIRHIDLNNVHEEFKRCVDGQRMEWFIQYGKQYGVDPIVLAVMCSLESSGNSNTVSSAGAKGLMQIMPLTGSALDKSYDFSTGKASKPLIFTSADFVDDEKSIEKAARLMNEYGNQVYHDVTITLAGYNAGIYGYKGKIGGSEAVKKIANTSNMEKKVVTKAAKEYLSKVAKFTPEGYDLFLMDRQKKLHFMDSSELKDYTGSDAIAIGNASNNKRPDFEKYNYDKVYIDKKQKSNACYKEKDGQLCKIDAYFTTDYVDEIVTGKAKPIELFVGMKNFWNEPYDISTADIENVLNDATLEQAIEFMKERDLDDDIHVEDLYVTDIEMLVRKIVGSNELAISKNASGHDVVVAGSLYRLFVSLENAEKGYDIGNEAEAVKMRGENQYKVEDYDAEIEVVRNILHSYTRDADRNIIIALSDDGIKKAVVKMFSNKGGDRVSFLNEIQVEDVMVPAYVFAKGLTEYPSFESLKSSDVKEVYTKYVKENEIDEALINAYVVGKYFERNSVNEFILKHSSNFKLVFLSDKVMKSQFRKDIKKIREMIDINESGGDIQGEDDADVISKRMRNALADDMFVKFALYDSNTDVMNIGEFMKLSCMLAENFNSQGCINYNLVSLPDYKIGLKSANIFTHTEMNVSKTRICIPDKIEVVKNVTKEVWKDSKGNLFENPVDYIGNVADLVMETVSETVSEWIDNKPENKLIVTGATISDKNIVLNKFQQIKDGFANSIDFVQRTHSSFKGLFTKIDTVEVNPNVYEEHEYRNIKKTVSIKSLVKGKDLYSAPNDSTARSYTYTELYEGKKNADDQTLVDEILDGALELARKQHPDDVSNGSRIAYEYNGVIVGFFSLQDNVYSGELSLPYLNRIVNFQYDLAACGENMIADYTYNASIVLKNANMEDLVKTLEQKSLGYGSVKISGWDFRKDLMHFYKEYTNVSSVKDAAFVEQFERYMEGNSTTVTSEVLDGGGWSGSVTSILEGFDMRMPFMSGVWTSGFGTRSCSGCSSNHKGYDIVSFDSKKRIFPVIDGVVYTVQNSLANDRGRYLVVEHVNENGEKLYTLYQHLKNVTFGLKPGDYVTADTVIGIEGGTGKTENSYGSHLHLEFSKDGKFRLTMNVDEELSVLTKKQGIGCQAGGQNLAGKICK